MPTPKQAGAKADRPRPGPTPGFPVPASRERSPPIQQSAIPKPRIVPDRERLPSRTTDSSTPASMPTRPILRSLRSVRPLGVLALAAFLPTCTSVERRGDANLQVALEIEPSPPQVGPATLSVVVTGVDWTPRNGAMVILTGLRDSLALLTDTARGQGAGRYESTSFGFEVAGEWLVNVRVETTDGRWVEVDHPVTVTAEGP